MSTRRTLWSTASLGLWIGALGLCAVGTVALFLPAGSPVYAAMLLGIGLVVLWTIVVPSAGPAVRRSAASVAENWSTRRSRSRRRAVLDLAVVVVLVVGVVEVLRALDGSADEWFRVALEILGVVVLVFRWLMVSAVSSGHSGLRFVGLREWRSLRDRGLAPPFLPLRILGRRASASEEIR
jgi:uncharacterized membrane protein